MTLAAVAAMTIGCAAPEEATPSAEPPPVSQSSPTTTPSAQVDQSGPAVPDTVTFDPEKEWQIANDVMFTGCGGYKLSSSDTVDEIRPTIFDTKTGEFVTAPIPNLDLSQPVNGIVCEVTGTAEAIRVVYIVSTTKPAAGLDPETTRNTVYLLDLTSPDPLATMEIPNLYSAMEVASSAAGIVLFNPYSKPSGGSQGAGTVVLSNTDLSVLWDDPEVGASYGDILRFEGGDDEFWLRSATGEQVFRGKSLAGNSGVIRDGADRFMALKLWDRETSYSGDTYTHLLDLNSLTFVKVGGGDRFPGGYGWTLSGGRLFINGTENSDATELQGLHVWNLRTQQMEFARSKAEVEPLRLRAVRFFENHLYLTTYTDGPDTFSVIALPDTNPIATQWSARPYNRFAGWTLVCHDETDGDCDSISAVRDVDGQYPGPWF